MPRRARSKQKNRKKSSKVRLEAFGALIIAVAGFFAVSGLITNDFYSSYQSPSERAGNLAGQAAVGDTAQELTDSICNSPDKNPDVSCQENDGVWIGECTQPDPENPQGCLELSLNSGLCSFLYKVREDVTCK